ncbi:MAG: hypothetical protein V1705_01180 [bacterium]
MEKNIYILRKTRDEFKNAAILWTANKDSDQLLSLCKKAFFGKVPFPIICLGDCRGGEIAKEQGVNLISGEAGTLKKTVDERGLDALVVLNDFDPAVDLPGVSLIKINLSPEKANEKEEIMRRLRDLGYR